jgi:fumarate reductase subunit D
VKDNGQYVGMKRVVFQILTINSLMKWDTFMKKPKKRNKIPFIILLIIHITMLGYSFYKSENKKHLFTLLMADIGFAYLLEYVVLNLFHAYTYKPKVLKKKIFDNVLGAILSQGIFVPFTAVFSTFLKIGWVGKIFGGVYFSLVELLFLRLKVYKHNWWRTIYTLLLLPLYFKISDWWNVFLNKRNPFARFISLFLMILVTEANLLFLFASTRKIRFGAGRYHSWGEHFMFVPLYAITLSLFSAGSFLKQNNWSSKLRVLLMTIGLDYIFKKRKVVKEKFHIVDYFTVRILAIFLYGKFSDFVYGVRKTVELKDIEDKLLVIDRE